MIFKIKSHATFFRKVSVNLHDGSLELRDRKNVHGLLYLIENNETKLKINILQRSFIWGQAETWYEKYLIL